GRRKQSDQLQERLMYWIAMSHIRLKQYEDAAKAFETITAKNAYSFYSLAAQARLEAIKSKLDEKKTRVPSALRPVPNEGTAGTAEAAESKESEEDIAEPSDQPAPVATDEGGEAEDIQASSFKDPALRARIDVATNLISLGLHELARWELIEVE